MRIDVGEKDVLFSNVTAPTSDEILVEERPIRVLISRILALFLFR